MPWDPKSDMQDMSGKVAIVTGGNTGIGKEIVRALALKNARVYMASRTESRALGAIEELKKEHKEIEEKDNITFLKLDLCDLKGTQNTAKEFLAKEERLDILVNNAGVMATPYELTKDGVELQFQSNHLGHFAFTTPLLPLLIKTSKEPDTSVRIVQVSSLLHIMAPKSMKFDSLESVNRKEFGPWAHYGQSKIANIFFAKELDRRLKGERIFCNAVHPGSINTELNRGPAQSYPYLRPFLAAAAYFYKTPYQGATTPLYAACAPEIEQKNWRGEYFVPMAKLGKASATTRDEKLAKDLWEFSERLVKEKIGDTTTESP